MLNLVRNDKKRARELKAVRQSMDNLTGVVMDMRAYLKKDASLLALETTEAVVGDVTLTTNKPSLNIQEIVSFNLFLLL